MSPLLENPELLDDKKAQIQYLRDKYGNTVGCHPSRTFKNKWSVYRDISVGKVDYIAVGTFEEIPYTVVEKVDGMMVTIPKRKITFVEDLEATESMNNKEHRKVLTDSKSFKSKDDFVICEGKPLGFFYRLKKRLFG